MILLTKDDKEHLVKPEDSSGGSGEQRGRVALEALLEPLVGTQCWDFTPGIGSVLSLGFGRKIWRPKPLKAKHPEGAYGRYEPEFCLMLYYCAWRFRHGNAVIGGWTDMDCKHSTAQMERRVLGGKVESVAIAPMTHDLRVAFDQGVTLDVFCNQAQGEQGYSDNYHFFGGQWIGAVGAKSVVSFERDDGGICD